MRAVIFGALMAMTTAAAGEPNAVLYQLQERCGKLAAEVFTKEYGNGRAMQYKDMTIFSGYRTHYNARLNKCY